MQLYHKHLYNPPGILDLCHSLIACFYTLSTVYPHSEGSTVYIFKFSIDSYVYWIKTNIQLAFYYLGQPHSSLRLVHECTRIHGHLFPCVEVLLHFPLKCLSHTNFFGIQIIWMNLKMGLYWLALWHLQVKKPCICFFVKLVYCLDKVCVPELVRNETRLEATSRIAKTMTRLLMSGLDDGTNFGKNSGKDGTTQCHLENSWMVLK